MRAAPSHCWLLCYLSLHIGFSALSGQQNDPVTDALSASRAEYEGAVEKVRERIRAAIARKLDEGAKKGGDTGKKLVDEARAETERFEAAGDWPQLKEGLERTLKNEASRANRHLSDAYTRAIAECAGAGRKAEADFLKAEQNAFENSNDMVPWIEIHSAEVPQIILSPAELPLQLNHKLSQHFRIWVRLQIKTPGTVLTCSLPTQENKRSMIKSSACDIGSSSLMLSVTDGQVIAEQGTPRLTQPETAERGGDQQILFAVESGSLIVESVKIKPILAAKVAATPALAAALQPRPAANKPAINIAGAFRAGDRFEGVFQNEKGVHHVPVIIQRATRAALVVRVGPTPWGSVRDWQFAVNGNNLVLTGTVAVKNPNGNQLKNLDVRGTLGNQSLSVSGSWIWQGPRAGGKENVSLSFPRN